MIQKLIKDDEENTIKKLLGEQIHRNVIKYEIHEANIQIENIYEGK